MQTLVEQLAEALEAHPLGFENHHPHLETPYDHECATCRFWRLGRDALARYRNDPETLLREAGARRREEGEGVRDGGGERVRDGG